MEEQKRIAWVDYMRSLGILLVIASHVFGTTHPILQLLFGCNVAIMIVISGYCSVRSSKGSVIRYYIKRGIQMIVQPWIFFVIYFGLVGLLSIGSGFPYSISQVLKTFLFLDGIGYTWIIAVFIITAFATPIIGFMLKKLPIVQWMFPISYCVLSFVAFSFNANHPIIKVLLYVFGYIFLSFVGFIICKNRKWLKYYLIGGTAVLICCLIVIVIRNGDVFDLSSNKYPPSIYYITYGMIVSLSIMAIVSKFDNQLSSCVITKGVRFISKRSFDIYLWHIFGLYIAAGIQNVWLKFLVVISISFPIAVVYNKIMIKMTNILTKKMIKQEPNNS